MTIHNYGSVWSIAHKIPKFWYGNCDENNRRLNTKANLGCDYEVGGYGEKTKQVKEHCPSQRRRNVGAREELLAG